MVRDSAARGAFQAIFHDGFCKSDHDFPIAFHSNVLYAMHGLRKNEVLLPTGYDVILSPPSDPVCWIPFFPFKKIAVTLALFHSSGIIVSSRDLLTMAS